MIAVFYKIANALYCKCPIKCINKFVCDYVFKFPKSLEVRKYVHFDNPRKTYFGEHVFINTGCNFYHGAGNCDITIDDNVYIGQNVSLICVSHEIGPSDRRAGRNIYKSIKIGKGVWVGANTTILPGVSIGEGSVKQLVLLSQRIVNQILYMQVFLLIKSKIYKK